MKHSISLKKTLVTGIALGALTVASMPMHTSLFISRAQADEASGPKGQAGPSGQGHVGSGSGNQGSIGGRGSGQGGPSSDSDAKGPRYGGGENSNKNQPGENGGKPAWAQDTIPEDVELGRLNVARAPGHVLEQSLSEALASIDPSLYTLNTLQKVLEAIKTNQLPDGSSFVRVDSPLENLALYKDILTDGKIGDGSTIVVDSSNIELLLAIFLGSAADKTIPITADTVNALSTIFQVELPSNVTAESLASDADQVRQAILEEHGE